MPVKKLDKVVIIENTLNLLEERVDMQLKESNKLLNRVKQHLKKTENLAKERDAKDHMDTDSKYYHSIVTEPTETNLIHGQFDTGLRTGRQTDT